jgi:hypothetical protein
MKFSNYFNSCKICCMQDILNQITKNIVILIVSNYSNSQRMAATTTNDTTKKNSNLTLSLLSSFKLIIIEQFLNSTSHGLPSIFRTRKIILKIMWLCCFLASSAWCIVSIIAGINEYLTYPTYKSTRIVKEVPTQFPAITICNLKTVNKTRSYSYIREINEVNFRPDMMPFEYIIGEQYKMRTKINNNKFLTEESKKKIGFELKDMLISCYFNYQSCDTNDFKYLYDPLYGNCYTFNKGVYDNGTSYEIKKLSITGPHYGLILELFLGDPKVDTFNDFNDGVLISIHNQSTKPFSQGDQIKAAAGAETDLIVSRNFITKLEYPYGDCLKDTKRSSKFRSYYFNYIVRTLGETYSQEYCYALCVQKQIMNKCNCSNMFMPIFKAIVNIHFCWYAEEIICVKNVFDTFGDTQATSECQIACPYECDSIEYEVTSYKAHYPTEFYADILFNKLKAKEINVSRGGIDKAFSKLNIFYKSMEYTFTTQKIQICAEEFFSNIGGTLGLCVGISILSFVEVVELGFNLVLAFMAFMKGKKTIKNTVGGVL